MVLLMTLSRTAIFITRFNFREAKTKFSQLTQRLNFMQEDSRGGRREELAVHRWDIEVLEARNLE